MTITKVIELPPTPEQSQGGYTVISFSDKDNFQTVKLLMEFYGLAAKERAEAWLEQRHERDYSPDWEEKACQG